MPGETIREGEENVKLNFQRADRNIDLSEDNPEAIVYRSNYYNELLETHQYHEISTTDIRNLTDKERKSAWNAAEISGYEHNTLGKYNVFLKVLLNEVDLRIIKIRRYEARSDDRETIYSFIIES